MGLGNGGLVNKGLLVFPQINKMELSDKERIIALERDMSWMKENLVLARSEHLWRITSVIGVLLGIGAMIVEFLKR